MPAPQGEGLVHRAVLWKRIGTDQDNRPVVENVAQTINCRWDATKRTVHGPDGSPVAIDATVDVDREIPVGSMLWRGDVDDLPGTGQTPDLDVMEVITSESADDVRGVGTSWFVTVARSGDALPATGADPED